MSATEKEEDIKTMKLYSNVDRVYNELKELGIKDEEPLDVEVLCKFDQYHYYGIKAVDDGIAALDIGPKSTVLDVGSGLGGPARYVGNKCKCHVIALELQKDLHDTGKDLTRRCGLSDNVRHIHGDFVQEGLGKEKECVDFLVSWFVFLHIDDKETLFDRCRSVLKPGGKIYIEDYWVINPLTSHDKDLLSKEVYVQRLDTKSEYIQHLENAGFKDVKFVDVTASWADFVKERVEIHKANRERYIRIHNEQIFNDQLRFFSAINEVFTGGNLGGCQVIATAGSD